MRARRFALFAFVALMGTIDLGLATFEASYWVPATGQKCATFTAWEVGFDLCTVAR